MPLTVTDNVLMIGAVGGTLRNIGKKVDLPEYPHAGQGTPTWHGTGPASGVLGLEPGSTSSKAVQEYFPKNGPIEFVFDPKTGTFAVGKPSENLGGSPHEQLAKSINASSDVVVGGIFKRGPNGEFITNEASGHYWQNWNHETRTRFEQTLKEHGINVIHHEGK